MLKLYVLLPDGTAKHEPDVIKWAIWFENHQEALAVGKMYIGKIWVSTTFISIDIHGKMFETMVFGKEAPLYRVLYATREEAVAGHTAMVNKVKLEVSREYTRPM